MLRTLQEIQSDFEDWAVEPRKEEEEEEEEEENIWLTFLTHYTFIY
jgi:hypothetical protein